MDNNDLALRQLLSFIFWFFVIYFFSPYLVQVVLYFFPSERPFPNYDFKWVYSNLATTLFMIFISLAIAWFMTWFSSLFYSDGTESDSDFWKGRGVSRVATEQTNSWFEEGFYKGLGATVAFFVAIVILFSMCTISY